MDERDVCVWVSGGFASLMKFIRVCMVDVWRVHHFRRHIDGKFTRDTPYLRIDCVPYG